MDPCWFQYESPIPNTLLSVIQSALVQAGQEIFWRSGSELGHDIKVTILSMGTPHQSVVWCPWKHCLCQDKKTYPSEKISQWMVEIFLDINFHSEKPVQQIVSFKTAPETKLSELQLSYAGCRWTACEVAYQHSKNTMIFLWVGSLDKYIQLRLLCPLIRVTQGQQQDAKAWTKTLQLLKHQFSYHLLLLCHLCCTGENCTCSEAQLLSISTFSISSLCFLSSAITPEDL